MITTTDYYGEKYEADPEGMVVTIHAYGIAVRDVVGANGETVREALISPQFDGYDWPGGTFKIGESTEDILRREFREETGYEVEPVQLLDVETSLFHHRKRGTDHHSLLVFYLVKIVGGELSDAGFDVDEREYAKLARWVPLAELRTMQHMCSIDIADKLLDFAEKAYI